MYIYIYIYIYTYMYKHIQETSKFPPRTGFKSIYIHVYIEHVNMYMNVYIYI
jgi:hypothetical protein